MRASIYDRLGGPDVVQLREVADPVPRGNEVVVDVVASALNPKDILIRKGRLRWVAGRKLPRIPGYDFSGTTADGRAVFGMIGRQRGGANAERVAVAPGNFSEVPQACTMVEAAGLPLAGLTALQALRDRLRCGRGNRVLLNGASGGVGTVAVQIAVRMGAEVTAVCSAKNRALVQSLGASQVWAYDEMALPSQESFDAVLDIYGNLPWPRARGLLARTGRYCTTVPTLSTIARGLLERVHLHRAGLVVVASRASDSKLLASWVDDGSLVPVVDSVHSLANAADAHRRIETRRARGKVILDHLRAV